MIDLQESLAQYLYRAHLDWRKAVDPDSEYDVEYYWWGLPKPNKQSYLDAAKAILNG